MYTHSRRGQSNERWAGHLICSIGGKSDEQATTILKKWMDEGVLETGEYHNPKTRKQAVGLCVNEAKLSEMRQALGVREYDD